MAAAMLTPSSSSLRLSTTPFPSGRAPFLHKHHAPKPFIITRATDPETPPPTESEPTSKPDTDDSFESRLSQVRFKFRDGTGKKAALRKAKKASSAKASMYLPPVPLKEPVSGGLKVDFGFSPYSERINGRISILGVSALLLVELATGKSVLNYHTPSIVLLQIYFVAAVSAMFIKFEKEKVSVWPESK